MEKELTKIDMETYLKAPKRYELRSGSALGAPLCPYGNHFEWIGYDLVDHIYVRFTKSVFKLLINQIQDQTT